MNDEESKPKRKREVPWFVRASYAMQRDADEQDLDDWCRAYDPDMPLEGFSELPGTAPLPVWENVSWGRL